MLLIKSQDVFKAKVEVLRQQPGQTIPVSFSQNFPNLAEMLIFSKLSANKFTFQKVNESIFS